MTPPSYEQMKPYENQWVALRKPDQQIVGNAKDISEAKQSASSRGYTEVIFLKVYPSDKGYIPSSPLFP